MFRTKNHFEKIRPAGPDISVSSGVAHPPAPHPNDIERDADSARQYDEGYHLNEDAVETRTVEYHAAGLPRTDRYSVNKNELDLTGTRTKSPRDTV